MTLSDPPVPSGSAKDEAAPGAGRTRRRRAGSARGAVVAAGFMIGAAFHLADIAAGGWMPYRFGPDAMNLFWSLLLPLDVAAAGLILWRRSRRPRLVLALAIMIADVAVNGYALWGLDMPVFAPALTMQTGFLLLLAAFSRALWRSGCPSPIWRR